MIFCEYGNLSKPPSPEAETRRRVKVYPNPANANVIISYNSKQDGVFILYNMIGDLVLKTTLSSGNSKTQIPILDIANGVYHYEIQFGNMKKTIGKFTILK